MKKAINQKLIIFVGILVAAYLIFQFNEEKILTVDILREMGVGQSGQEGGNNQKNAESAAAKIMPKDEYLSKVFKLVYKEENFDEEFEDDVFAAILPADKSAAKDVVEYFLRLKETQKVAKFLLIADDERTFESMKQIIELIFPKAEIVLSKIGSESDGKAIENDDALVIGLTDFADGLENRNVIAFHDELTKEIFANFDVEAVNQMDVKNRDVVKTVMEYAQKFDGQKSEIVKNAQFYNRSYFLVNFYEGEPTDGDRELTILSFGDLMLGRYVRTLMNSNGLDYVFEKIADKDRRFFEGADIVHGNLEGPIKDQGISGGTSMVFKFNEDVAPLLKEYGFTLLSIANNHAMDGGWDGRDTTIEALESAGIGWCGHPRDVDSGSVFYGSVADKKYAFVCFHDVTFKLDDEAAASLIKKVRSEVDFLIVSIHWGYEYKHSPNYEAQVKPGRAFVDAGADLVIGHHPHVVQSFEIYNGKPIFYSLGNFVFDQYWSTETQEELAIGVVLGNEKSKIYLFPMKSEKSQSRLMDADEREVFIEEFLTYGEYDEETTKMIKDGLIEIAL
ncbi:CapA family protein [Candidatus Peregrinibacteria bacterium]|nr:CapA family protein [Candidatus Peregrinibacteria bacterium]